MKYETRRAPVAVILASEPGTDLAPLTDLCPKALLAVGGSAILERMIRNCLSCGISQFVIVLGHRADQVRQSIDKSFRGIRVTYVMNERYHDTGSAYAMMLAARAVGTSDIVRLDTGLVFDAKILRQVLDSDWPTILCVDSAGDLAKDPTRTLSEDKGLVHMDADRQVLHFGPLPATVPAPVIASVTGSVTGSVLAPPASPDIATQGASEGGDGTDDMTAQRTTGTLTGIDKLSNAAAKRLFAELTVRMDSPMNRKDNSADAYEQIHATGTVFHTIDVSGMNWTRIDTKPGLVAANAMFASPITTVSRGQQRAIDEAVGKPVTPL